MTIGSLFAGIGGFDRAFDRAGFKTLWQCELDANCRKLLAARWPDAKLWDDITKCTALPDIDGTLKTFPEGIKFGTCQNTESGKPVTVGAEKNAVGNRALSTPSPGDNMVGVAPGLVPTTNSADTPEIANNSLPPAVPLPIGANRTYDIGPAFIPRNRSSSGVDVSAAGGQLSFSFNSGPVVPEESSLPQFFGVKPLNLPPATAAAKNDFRLSSYPLLVGNPIVTESKSSGLPVGSNGWDLSATPTGAVNHFHEQEYRRQFEHCLIPTEVITAGFPCQDLSVAGKRDGLHGSRSGLFFHVIRIIKEMRYATNGQYPRFVLLENVPGLLSSNKGRDFATVLYELAECGALDIGWAVLDAQWFGLAQRRKRVFLVADFRGQCAEEILSLAESLCGNNPPGREARQEVTGTISARTKGGGGLGTDFECGGGLVTGAVSSKWAKGTGGPSGDECYNLVAHTLSSEGHDASEDGTGMGTPLVAVEPPRFTCLKCQHGFGVNDYESNTVTCPKCGNTGIDSIVDRIDSDPIDFCNTAGNTALGLSLDAGRTAPPITLRHGDPGCVAIPIQEIGKRQSGGEKEGVGHGKDGDPMFTLQAGAQHGVALAFQPKYYTRDNKTGGAPSDISPPICAAESRSRGDAVTAVAFTERTRADGRNFEWQEDLAYALTNPSSGGRTDSRNIATSTVVRRLTPNECLKLMGFPDDWFDGLGFSDSTKYRAIGNSVAVPVVEWIARRIAAQLERYDP